MEGTAGLRIQNCQREAPGIVCAGPVGTDRGQWPVDRAPGGSCRSPRGTPHWETEESRLLLHALALSPCPLAGSPAIPLIPGSERTWGGKLHDRKLSGLGLFPFSRRNGPGCRLAYLAPFPNPILGHQISRSRRSIPLDSMIYLGTFCYGGHMFPLRNRLA
jgi:hypothetical protein